MILMWVQTIIGTYIVGEFMCLPNLRFLLDFLSEFVRLGSESVNIYI